MDAEALAREVVETSLILAVEGDDGETLSGPLLASVMDALDLFLVVPSLRAEGSPELRRDLLGLDAASPLGAAVRATHHLIWVADSRIAGEDEGWFDRAAVDAWRRSLEPFGLAEREADFHGPGPGTAP